MNRYNLSVREVAALREFVSQANEETLELASALVEIDLTGITLSRRKLLTVKGRFPTSGIKAELLFVEEKSGEMSIWGGIDMPSRNNNSVFVIALALGLLPRQPGAPKSEQPEVQKRSSQEVSLTENLQVLFQQKSKRPLGHVAKKAARTIEQWWNERKKTVTKGELTAVLSPRSAQWYQQDTTPMTLWVDSAPATPLDLFYLAVYAGQTADIFVDHELLVLVDKARMAQLARPLARMKEISAWKERLRELPEDDLALSHLLPELRLRITASGVAVDWKTARSTSFEPAKHNPLRDLVAQALKFPGSIPNAATQIILEDLSQIYSTLALRPYNDLNLPKLLLRLLRLPSQERDAALRNATGEPLLIDPNPLRWQVVTLEEDSAAGLKGDYQISLTTHEGKVVNDKLLLFRGSPFRILTNQAVHHIDLIPIEPTPWKWPMVLAAEVIESPEGIKLLKRMGLPIPDKISTAMLHCPATITVTCTFSSAPQQLDCMDVSAVASWDGYAAPKYWQREALWQSSPNAKIERQAPAGKILSLDSTNLSSAAAWLGQMVAPSQWQHDFTESHDKIIRAHKEFPNQFTEWLDECPKGVTVVLDPELASLREGKVSGTFNLEFESSGVDWFDLRLNLEVSDTTLTDEEIKLLLGARGKWVRIKGKGWRKLEFNLTPEQEKELADLGLVSSDFGAAGEKQRLHVLQLAGAKSKTLLSADNAAMLKRRADEIQTSVTPPLPAAIKATLRPYQETGFHFLAYLTTNRFGGILADDMGLGKTLQTLTWLAWLLDQQPSQPAAGKKRAPRLPSLVVCPKSVMDNWLTESARFFPTLKVKAWSRSATGTIGDGKLKPDLLIIHYQQLRQHEALLQAEGWLAVILDEAQYIKNPTSQTTKIACGLRAEHRLALSGTPVENRLLDLWSIMSFSQPGALGSKAYFTRNFDAKADPLARRRLAARVRPFLLRRTKSEVARDLPERTEEDIHCEMDGTQAGLYQAELKRARAMLLKANTAKALDGMRFNILSSLLRLRQICCHPKLVGSTNKKDESAKLDALLDLLEPLMEEGHKVLIFSQFVEMLELIKEAITERMWPHYLLTGSTDDRGPLVQRFQAHEGNAVFLISLKAGGAGLNLTAASYVVLFDPWWNPAVEAQAIDRTHRIGQTQNVIAYRLLVKDSIEEKIRQLQKQKSALAEDVLGEDAGSALTLADFRFLLGGEDAE